MQYEVLNHLERMTHPEHPQPRGPVTAVLPTGGGKSAIRDAHAIAHGMFTLTIVPLLSVGSDQASKIRPFSRPSTGLIHSINLDDYRTKEQQAPLVDRLRKVPYKSKQTILLFSSPQMLTDDDNKILINFVQELILNKRLVLLAVDEIQLYVEFGLDFRDEFKKLKPVLFDKLWYNRRQYKKGTNETTANTSIPILFMTATASKRIFHDMTTLTGIELGRDLNSVFWGNALTCMNRTQRIIVSYTTQPLSEFKKHIVPKLKECRVSKYMWLCNNRFLVEKHEANLVQEFDEDLPTSELD